METGGTESAVNPRTIGFQCEVSIFNSVDVKVLPMLLSNKGRSRMLEWQIDFGRIRAEPRFS